MVGLFRFADCWTAELLYVVQRLFFNELSIQTRIVVSQESLTSTIELLTQTLKYDYQHKHRKI